MKPKTIDPLTAGLDLNDPNAWVVAEQLPTLYPNLWGNSNAVKWDLRNRESNGFADFVRILGRKSIVHHAAAARWKLATARATDPRYG
jgi:hypothetical protein